MKAPKNWKTVRLAEIVDPSRPISYGVVQTGENIKGGIPCVRVVDLTEASLDPARMIRTSPEISASYSRTVLQAGDLMMALRGEIGKAALVPTPLVGVNLTRGIALLSKNPAKFHSPYLLQALSSPKTKLALRHGVNGTGLMEIPIGNLREVIVDLPPLPEQQKIAEILGTWDEALEKLDALIAAKARRKQALMQQLLAVAAQKIGHGNARHRLGEVVERVTRKNAVGNDNVLTISAQYGLINQREYFNRSVAGADLSGYFLLRRGEFAYNRSSSIGFPYGAIKRLDRYDAGVVSTLYLCFRTRDTAKVSADYLAHYLDGGFLNAGLRSVAKEGARAHGLLNITADEFMDIDVFLPPLALQTKIAAVLDTADAELRLLRQQRTALDHQKRGLMQQLLTGRIRVAAK